MLKRMTLYISTGDGVVGYGAVYLSWGRCGRKWGDKYLLGTELKSMLLIPTGDDNEENGTVHLYSGRCGRVWRCMSLLETVW